MQLEGEPVGVLAGGKLVLLERGGREGPQPRGETGLDGGDPFLDRPGAGAHLQRRGGEEAAAGEDTALHVAEERLARRRQLAQARAGASAGWTTSSVRIRSASSTVASWSSCLVPKCA